MKAFGEDGQILDAEFDIEEAAAGFEIVLHSNGGVSRGKPAYNPDYIRCLETILTRLAAIQASLDGAWVDSKALADLGPDRRRVGLETANYPIRLFDVSDIRDLRLQIRRSVSRIGRAVSQTPGTGNKKLRLAVSFESRPSLSTVELALRGVAVSEQAFIDLGSGPIKRLRV